MNVRYIIHDQTFKKFLVGLVVLVGLTGLGIYSAKNILPSVNDKIAKTNDVETGKTDVEKTLTKPPVDSLLESEDDYDQNSTKTNQSQADDSSSKQQETEQLKSSDSLPTTGNNGALNQAVALGIITFSFAHIFQIRNKF